MKGSVWIAVAALACTACRAPNGPPERPRPSRPAVCSLPVPTTTIRVEHPIRGELHQVYDLNDRADLWRRGDALVADYRHAVQRRLRGPVSPRALLERQYAIFRGLPGGDKDNLAAALSGVGHIRPATCLEARLWQVQNRRYPMLGHPTELGAFILRRGRQVRVYFSAADRLGQKIRGAVTSRVRADVTTGYRLVAHLHNHPFLLDRRVGDRLFTRAATKNDVGGALAPSATDVQFYLGIRRELRLEAAWVTNGFDTAEYSHTVFHLLRAAARPRRRPTPPAPRAPRPRPD